MLWFYRLLIVPVLLLASPYYLTRMRRRGGYRDHFSQRFGATPALPPKGAGVRRVWLQAVSVGEMLAIAPILEALKADPAVEVYLSTTTSTGYQLARERYSKLVTGLGYFPIDAWPFSRRAWRAIGPDLVILTEGERWPEHIHQARIRGVPVLAVNARLSDRSFRRMRAARWLVQPLLGGISHVLACSEADGARFRELGFPGDRVVVTGNIKLDVTLPLLTETAKASLRRELGLPAGRLLVLGSSTWPGEEQALLTARATLVRAGLPAVAWLLVPRHAERRGEIESLMENWLLGARDRERAADEAGQTQAFHFRSRGVAPGEVEVAVGDTTGELRQFTQLADVVFVGKSLPPHHHEGQTPVEAAALGKPILFGPEMSNFRAIARDLVACGAAQVVRNEQELAERLQSLLRNPEQRAAMSAAAQAWHRANQGAVGRTLAVIRAALRTR